MSNYGGLFNEIVGRVYKATDHDYDVTLSHVSADVRDAIVWDRRHLLDEGRMYNLQTVLTLRLWRIRI